MKVHIPHIYFITSFFLYPKESERSPLQVLSDEKNRNKQNKTRKVNKKKI